MKPNLQKLRKAGEGTFQALVQFGLFALTKPGFKYISQWTKRYLRKLGVFKEPKFNYDLWIRKRENLDKLRSSYSETIGDLPFQPSFLIIAFTSRIDEIKLKEIEQQVYTKWELHVVGAAKATENEYKNQSENAAISFHEPSDTEILRALEEIVTVSDADYILFLEPGTALAPDLLFECVKLLNRHPETDLIYTDEDTLLENGCYVHPFFKPCWSPDTLLTRNYIGASFLIRTHFFKRLNGFRAANYAAHFDLLLRASEITKNIARLPIPLIHKQNEEQELLRVDPALLKEVISDALMRRNTPGIVSEIDGAIGCFEVLYEVNTSDKISIIIPTKDQAALLKVALDSIIEKTEYTNYELIVINNNSVTPAFFNLVNAYTASHPGIFRVVDAAMPFNFSKLINIGVGAGTGSYLLFLNNDIEVIEGTWLTNMLGYAQQKHIGAVGVKLLYPDDIIQHAGIAIGIGEATAHVLAHEKRESAGHFDNLKAATNYAAVTAACMMVNRKKFLEVGAMDESLPVEYNDVDLCLKLYQRGYYNVYLPQVEVYHYESATRGHPFRSIKSWQQHDADLRQFLKKWQYIVDSDPFYNPNLTKTATDFSWKGQ